MRRRIPSSRGLAGRALYAVAIVRDPSMPDGVRVKSSVATIQVLP